MPGEQQIGFSLNRKAFEPILQAIKKARPDLYNSSEIAKEAIRKLYKEIKHNRVQDGGVA